MLTSIIICRRIINTIEQYKELQTPMALAIEACIPMDTLEERKFFLDCYRTLEMQGLIYRGKMGLEINQTLRRRHYQG